LRHTGLRIRDFDIGGNTDCEGNFSFEDENEDGMVDDDEVGEALSCE